MNMKFENFYLHFLFLCSLWGHINGEIGEMKMMEKWANFHELNGENLKLEKAGNPFQEFSESRFDLFFPSIPHVKPVDELNLSPDCAADVQFFRDSRKLFKDETKKVKQCGNDTECRETHTKIRNSVLWSIQQLDAMGKIPPGLLKLNGYWHGDYGECIGIDIDRPGNATGRYQGKFCYAMMSLRSLLGDASGSCPADKDDYTQYGSNVRWALCVPNTCKENDTLALVEQFDKLKEMACNVFCIERETTFTTGAIAMIALFSLIGAIVIIASVVDYLMEQYSDAKPDSRHICTKLLLCFSIYTNGKKILDMSKRGGQLECLHGIRVMSMLWVILGHTYMHIQYVDNLADAYKLKNDWSIQVVNNATFTVDTFFTMSGFLVAYLWLKEEEKLGSSFIKSKKTWILYYVHRYIRLTPIFMLIIGLNATLVPYFIRGPHQYDLTTNTDRNCKETWWTNLIYVNNIVKPTEQCYGPAWYLPNDMQFYALTPFILLLLLYSPTVGFLFSLTLILGSMAGTAATIAMNHFPPMPMAGVPKDPALTNPNWLPDFMRLVYMAPWTRFPPYLIGVLFGYLWQKGLCRVKLNKLIALIFWVLAFVVGLAVIYGLTDYTGGKLLPVGVRALYGAASRPAWSLCICWLMFACLTGRGGIINEFLSWRGWLPLSRLSYCTYLLHFTFIEVIFAANDFPLHWDSHMDWISKWMSIVFMTTFASFFVSCALEAPIIGLEKLLLKPAISHSTQKVAAIPESLNNDKKQLVDVVDIEAIKL